MRWSRFCILALTTLSLKAQGELRLATGITPAQNIFSRIQVPFEKATGIRLVLRDARSPEAWRLLDAGEVDAAAGALTWEDWRRTISARNLRLPGPGEVTWLQIGVDQIQVLTSPDILFLDLGREELQALFTGKVTNWKRLGGPDAPVTVLVIPSQAATNDAFAAQILDGQPFAPSPWTAPKGTTLLEAVAATPHAIGFAPKAAQESVKVNSPMTPTIERPILLLIKGARPGAGIAKLLAFLDSPEGRKLVVR